ncbi:uncharacterized protein LOC126985337 [Eriocheir sinensis]|uniref:uncharacterized protein LOC126985337 n=1 Tax=Eriocheir sinensis TaxID=95602 RepID=UPI0021C5A6C6|nr:uncharacterized protein LOC126985337 [Eriocheir sinensis]
MRSALLITTLVASALAGPTGVRDSCAQHCSQDNIFSYQQGRSYEYEYSVTTTTGLLGDQENEALVQITARAHIDVLAPCEYTLRLTKVSLQGSSHSEEMAEALTRSSLRFAFQDGNVEELCAAEAEEAWVLNFKRGVLSAFQTSRTSPGNHEVHETDVLGMCLTNYENKLEGDVLTVVKVKDVRSCSRRADIASYLSSAYSTDSPVQSLPIIDSTSFCTQKVEGGVLTDTHCEETHSFTPFSGQRGGAVTSVDTRLTLVARDGPAITPTEQSLVRKTPVFEAATEATAQDQVEAVTALLTQLDEAAREEVRPQAPALFSRLVIVLRGLDYPVLSRIYAATTETHPRRFLVDAMPLVGTAAAAGLVRDMFANGDITQEEVDAWFTSLAHLKNPTSDIFTAIAPMLDNEPSQSALLGTSALVNTFCKTHAACGDDSGVQQVVRRVEAQLGSGCRALNEEQKVKILVALRALGNAGRWVNARPVLQRCYTEDNDMEVRVAAIEAWRHTPCEYDRSGLLAAYLDEAQDPEVRIAAYLSVMTCPTPQVLAAVRDRLTSEGVNQVGSFVWTHLTNLQESAAPGKEWARLLIGEELLANKFTTEALRFSRNYESSFFMNEINLGAAVESNVIFSSKSYLPRSGMLNLTLDLFGESVNLFEVGGRIEGFENYLERLFGPDGYFPEDTVAAALRGMHHHKPEAEATTLEQFLEDATDEPRGSYYLRLFGNDVHYRRFHGLGGSSSQAEPSPFSLLMELARGGNVDYTKSYQLLDTHISVPTVAGLPLTLGAKSSATVGLRMDGSFRAQSLADVRIEGHVRPSAAVTVDGVMLVDAHVTRAGVKVSSTLHTSTSLEGKVTIDGGVLVDVAFNTPKQRMEIVNYESKFFLVQDSEEVERDQATRSREGCVDSYLGMAVCSEVALQPRALLPSVLRVYLDKTDTQTGYTFRFTKTPTEIAVVFNNPEARVSRRVALTLRAENSKVVAEADTFLGKVEARGEYLWSRDKKTVQARADAGPLKFNIDAGLLTSFGSEKKVETYLQLDAGQTKLVNAKAELAAIPQQNSYSADLFFAYMEQPMGIKVSYEGAAATKGLGITFTSKTLDATLDGKLDLAAKNIQVTTGADIMLPNTETKRFDSTLLLEMEREGDATTYSSRLDINLPYHEDPVVMKYGLKFSPTELNCEFDYKQGSIDLTAREEWLHTYEAGVRRIKGHVSTKSEYLNIEQTANTEIIFAADTIYLKSVVDRIRGDDAGTHTFLVDLKRNPGTSLTGLIKFDTVAKFTATAEFLKVNPGHYTAEVEANAWSPIRGDLPPLSAKATLKDNSGPAKFDINAEGSFTFRNTDISVTSVVYGDPQQAKVDLQTKFNSKTYGMKVDATRSSLLIDANVVKHVVVNAKMNHQGPEKTLAVGVEWDKETNPDNTFKIEGKIAPNTVTADFKFLEKEFSTVGRLVPQGVEAEASWSPSQRAAASFQYALGAAPSVTASLETTVPGWEKQGVDVRASLQDNEVTCRASATWRNSQQAALAVVGRLQDGGSLQGEVTFSSTIPDMERFSLTFEHTMAGAAITSSLQGAWNDRQLTGSFELAPTSTGLRGRALFTSHFTQMFEATLSHQLQDATLDSSLLVTYGGTQLAKATSTGRFSLAQDHNVDLAVKLTTDLDGVADAEASVKYSLDAATLRLVLDAQAGQRKMMLTVNGEKTVTAESTAISGDLRFLTPFTKPLTASFTHTHDGRRFTSQFEVTRLWSTYSFGSLKMHAEGHFLSEKDINLSAYISSPETKGSFSFVHKIENNKLSTVAKVYANRELISVSINGTLDSGARVLSLEGDITSSFEGLDMKVKVDSKREGDAQNTRVDIAQGTQAATLTHSFAATDALNWENTFSLNEQYSLKNKMALVGGEYQHLMEATWDEQRVAISGRLTPVLTAESRKLDGRLELDTPWECLQNKLDFTFEQQTRGETTAAAELEYKPGRKITASTTSSFNHEGELLSRGSLTTPFWQPLSYGLRLALRPGKEGSLTLTHGEATNVDLLAKYQPGRINFQFNLATPSLQHPLGVEGSYDTTNAMTSAGLAFIYYNKYEAKTTFSGTVLDGGWELSLREYAKLSQEWTAVHQLDGSWEHRLAEMPYSIDASLRVENNEYQAEATIDETSFTSKMVLNGREGSLAARWLLQPTNSNLSVLFQSPVELVKDFDLGVSFDTEAMEGQLKVKYNTQEVDLLAKMEEETFVFEGKTPFSGWETLGASFFASGTAINAHVSRNERKIEVTGTQHLRPAKGKLELVVITPYAGFETVSFDASYNFLSENKTVKFKTVYGTAEIFAKGVIKIGDPLAPQVILNISTPFSELRTLRATADWNLNSAAKTAAAKVVYNEREFSWNLEAALQGAAQRVTSKVTTPFSGWSQASLDASIAVSEAPYEVRVTVAKEGVTKDFRGRLMLDNNAIHGEVTTPIPGWEEVALEGTYTRRHDTFTAAVRATCGQHTYALNTDLLFDTYNPKLQVEVTTPFAQAANLKLDVEGSLAGPQKTLNVIVTKNDVTFSAEASFKLQNKTGSLTLKLRSPVPGFSTLEVEGSYDLLSDVKRTELSVTKEGQRQHFAVAATLNDNHVVLDVATPFPGFQTMKMDADYTSSAPGQHLVVASFLKDRETYNFRSDVEVRGTSVVVRLATPIAQISRVVLDARYQMLRGACEGSVRFERNSDVFELRAQCGFTPAACSLSLEAATPIAGWNTVALHLNYKVESNKLSAGASVQRDAFRKEVSVEAAYGPEQGSLTLRTPVPDWEVLGAEYVLSVTGGSEAKAMVKVTRNSQEFAFSAYGRYTRESIAFRFQTPFQGYEESSLQASVNAASRSAKANLQVGSYTFSANGSYNIGDMFLELATPFPALRFGSVAVKYAATPGGLEASITVVHNENNYFLIGEASVSPRSSAIVLQTQTPLAALPDATLKLKYNLNSPSELLAAQLAAGESTYSLALAAELQEKLASLKVEMNTPFRGWTQVKFEAKVDLTQEDKALELVVEREGSTKAITVYGKLIGSALNFDLRTPFAGLNRMNVSGSLDRVRRSVEFQMMNDAGEASILASFNCVKFELKTPFSKVEEVSFEIKKEDDNYYGTWKRNDNYLTLELVKDADQQTVNLEIKSELQGWEFLALTGRLDPETEQAYASGQINEEKVEVTISGTRDDRRRTRQYTLDLKTPYDNYNHVTGELRFGPRRRTIIVESNSSPFKIDLKSSRRTGLQVDIFVPNPTQNTEFKLDLTTSKGNIELTSRFPILRSLHYEYVVNLGSETEMTQKLEINRMEVFTMEFKANAAAGTLHLDIHGRRPGRHLNLHIHKEGLNVFNVILKREVTIGGSTTEKQLSLEMTGTGDLPQQGTVHATITNSFVAVPRTTTVHAEIDRTSSPKTVKLEVTLPGNKLYSFDIQYNADLGDPRQGDFRVHVNTPDRMAAPWKDFSGNWDVQNPEQAKLEFEFGGRTYKAEGKLGLRESDLVATAEGVPERVFLQWRFLRNYDERDYYVKVGPESSYRMAKLKGSIHGIDRGNIEGGIKASFQPHEFLFTTSWERSRPGAFSSQGDFSYGQYRGTHNFQLNRDAATKSASFQFNADSNHPNYKRVVLNGNYDVLDKLVFKAEATVNDRVNKIDIDISDLNPRRSRNSIEAAFPFLPPEYRTFQMTLRHDFRRNSNKFIHAEATIGQRESHLKANWKRSDDFDVLEGTLDINSIFIGEVNVGLEYDMSNINDAHAKVHYKRIAEGQPEKKVDASWTRKRTEDRLEAEVTLDTTFELLQHARAYATADFSQLFTLDAGLDLNDKHATIKLDVGGNAVQMEITTPIPNFENIKGTINYNLGGKNQSVTLHYERGDQKVDLELNLIKKSKKKGDLTLNLTTPFQALRILKIEATWNKRQASVEYLRNDVRVSMTGTAQLDANNSEFNLSFTAPSGRAVTIAAAYDVEAFISGTGTSPAKLAALAVDIGETKARFELNGFRSSERLYVEVHGESSFELVRNFHLKLDSELNTQKRDGAFEFRLNEFIFEMHNHFERFDDGYYTKSRIESSLTPLPALVFGLGRRGSELIFTLGYGEEKELTFSIKAKNGFRDGFTGSVDIPNFGYDGVEYDVTYSFPSNDELEIELKAELGGTQHLEAEFEYKSDGVKARLTSPFTGEHSARVRRSVTADGFFSEVAFDDYSMNLRGGFQEGDMKRGVVLEADILGREFLFNYQLQSEGPQYTEGKLVLQTPFRGWEKMGGLFTFSSVSRRVLARAEVFIPFFLNIPRITGAIDLDLNDKIEGEVTLNVAGEQFSLRSSLTGASLQEGLQGTVWLVTPFHALPRLEAAGKIKMPSLTTLEADLKITHIYTTYEIDLSYELSSTQKKVQLHIDDNFLTAECTMGESRFTMSVDTRWADVRRQLSVDTRYSMLEDLEGSVTAVLGEHSHKLQGVLSIAGNRVRGEVNLESSFIGGVRKLEFNATVPNTTFDQVSFSVTLTATQVHAFSLDLDTRQGLEATAKIDTPAFPQATATLQLTWPRAALTVTTPEATHTAALSWRQTRKMPADQIVNVELDTPLLGQRYALSMVVGGSRSKAVVKAELQAGSVKHTLEAETFKRAAAGGFAIHIETPFQNIQRVTLSGLLDMSAGVTVNAVANLADSENAFVFIYNAEQGTLLAEAASPYIPTGLVKASAEVTEESANKSLQVALTNSRDVISGRFDLTNSNNNEVIVRATISTPMEALKTVNAVIKYQKAEVTHMVFSLDHPITFRAEVKFSNTDDKFIGNVTAKTSIASLEYVEADIEIPFTEFAPRASLTLPKSKYGFEANYSTEGYTKKAAATLYLDDQSHGANLGFRSKAPYELAYKYHILNCSNAFHLRTDSSFFTLLM